jgi:hypothetical protein
MLDVRGVTGKYTRSAFPPSATNHQNISLLLDGDTPNVEILNEITRSQQPKNACATASAPCAPRDLHTTKNRLEETSHTTYSSALLLADGGATDRTSAPRRGRSAVSENVFCG